MSAASVQEIDFQTLLQTTIGEIMQYWVSQEVPEDVCQEQAGTLFQMGTIAVQQMQSSEQIQIENAPDPVDVTPELAEIVVVEFIWGLQEAYLQAYKEGIPPAETMEIIQQTAMYVFEQTKNIAVAALGQKMAGQEMPHDQLRQYLSQTASGAFTHFLSELEKQRGSIQRIAPEGAAQGQGAFPEIDPEVVGSLDQGLSDTSESDYVQEDGFTPGLENTAPEVVQHVAPASVQQQVTPSVSPEQYYLAALGLVLSSLPDGKRQEVRQLFLDVPENQIQYFKGLQEIPSGMNTQYLLETIRDLKKNIKTRLNAQPKTAKYYHQRTGQLLVKLPQEQSQTLITAERMGLHLYVDQFVKQGPRAIDKPQKLLPQGVLQSFLEYLKKHFPHVISS